MKETTSDIRHGQWFSKEKDERVPLVYIIILTWNRANAVIKCLISLNSLVYPNFCVVVVDNNSQDSTVDYLSAIFPRLTVILNERNFGYTEGNNIGITYALKMGADYVLLLNNDTTVHPELINRLVSVAEADNKIAVVGPKNLMMERRRIIWAAWTTITYGPELTRVTGPFEADGPDFRCIREVDQVVGCGYMWRREALEDIGLLDANFFGYHEDVDWCYRARRKGWRVVYVGSAIVYHEGSLSASVNHRKCIPMMYFLGRNAILFARKHGNLFNILKLCACSAIGSLRRLEQSEGLSAELEFWRGFLDGWRNRNRKIEFRN